MHHDDPADRPYQDPLASLPCSQQEAYFRERIAFFEAQTSNFPDVKEFAETLTRYRSWLTQHLATQTATEAWF